LERTAQLDRIEVLQDGPQQTLDRTVLVLDHPRFAGQLDQALEQHAPGCTRPCQVGDLPLQQLVALRDFLPLAGWDRLAEGQLTFVQAPQLLTVDTRLTNLIRPTSN